MEDALSESASSQQRLERAPCANLTEVNGLRVNCDNEANLVCSQCFLVKVNSKSTGMTPNSQAYFDLSTADANAKRRTGPCTRSRANRT